MHIALWIVAILLALVFAAAGIAKLVTPRERLVDKMEWVTNATDGQVKAVGALELAGALGLVLPAAFGIMPVLVPIAALGLTLVMVGAVVTHARMREPLVATLPAVVLGLLSLFVAWGRFGPYSF